PAFSAAFLAGSGGNPLYLSALLDAVQRQGLAPIADHAPHVLAVGSHAVSYGITTRLSRLSSEARDLLRAAALLGDRADLALAAEVAGVEPEPALTAAGALVRSDLLRRENPVEFMHPVVRTAVLEDIDMPDRVRGHRRAADALLSAGAPAAQAAAHLAQTLPRADPFVVTTLRAAAERALAQGAPEAAVAYLRRAVDEPPAR